MLVIYEAATAWHVEALTVVPIHILLQFNYAQNVHLYNYLRMTCSNTPNKLRNVAESTWKMKKKACNFESDQPISWREG
jgi:hypothetical protein